MACSDTTTHSYSSSIAQICVELSTNTPIVCDGWQRDVASWI